MKVRIPRRGSPSFTLVELLVVIAIIGLLVSLGGPAYTSMIARANSIKCATNLRSIGVAVNLAAADNNNQYPKIDQIAGASAYPTDNPAVLGLVGVLGPYGVSSNTVLCPIDVQQGSAGYFSQKNCPNPGSSYEWNPAFDDESTTSPVIYIRPGQPIPVAVPRVRLVQDFGTIHHNKSNALYADGRVVSH